ncbi:hypothetical protein KY331_01445 [Candidatus Woesearchaeota archaeon]|nr:hypothetical protein [Candidatus Woesearchaeota archaeon]
MDISNFTRIVRCQSTDQYDREPVERRVLTYTGRIAQHRHRIAMHQQREMRESMRQISESGPRLMEEYRELRNYQNRIQPMTGWNRFVEFLKNLFSNLFPCLRRREDDG